MIATARKAAPRELSLGDAAPDFTLRTDGGNKVSLSSFLGKKNVVLYFYPKDDTPGCTVEARDFGSMMDAFKALDTEVIGVSKDSVQSHDKFKEKYCLPFTLAADEAGVTCADYGVWVEKSMYGKSYMGIERATFLIDKGGIVRGIWRKVKVEGHARDVLEAVKGLR